MSKTTKPKCIKLVTAVATAIAITVFATTVGASAKTVTIKMWEYKGATFGLDADDQLEVLFKEAKDGSTWGLLGEIPATLTNPTVTVIEGETATENIRRFVFARKLVAAFSEQRLSFGLSGGGWCGTPYRVEVIKFVVPAACFS
jgi:hypothetical protein